VGGLGPSWSRRWSVAAADFDWRGDSNARDPLRTGVTRALFAWVVIVVSALVELPAQAVTQPALKAAFLFNFGKFVEWPVDSSQVGPLSVCVLDDTAVEESLEQLIVGGPPSNPTVTLVKSVRNRSLRGCRVLYLGDHDPTRIAATLDELKSAPILTVGDGDRFARVGGMIGLFVEEGRMRFAINADAVQRAGLRLSSRLLNLAKIVKEGRHGQS
jgi:hypothetical protein